jgi:hypothetical protein
MSADTIQGILIIALGAMLLLWAYANHRWQQADLESERRALRREMARRLNLRE